MLVNGISKRTVWIDIKEPGIVKVIDQRNLPHEFVVENLSSLEHACTAIKEMHIRGAGCIGAVSAFAMYLASLEALSKTSYLDWLEASGEKLKSTRPTAVNLEWAVNRQLEVAKQSKTLEEVRDLLLREAQAIADEDVEFCRRIGHHGVKLIKEIAAKKDGPVNILTHCNAGWLAFVDYGTATSPIYRAVEEGIEVHVWVDETRPRNQGARLTAWELKEQGVPHTIISDNVGGHLMQHGLVDMCIVGSDRTTCTGDVANKIGTYLKALAAKDNNVPFYVALPSSSIDWSINDGIKEIPIEKRGGDEVKFIQGQFENEIVKVLLTPEDSTTINYGFDVTPARLITSLITERGVVAAQEECIKELFVDLIK